MNKRRYRSHFDKILFRGVPVVSDSPTPFKKAYGLLYDLDHKVYMAEIIIMFTISFIAGFSLTFTLLSFYLAK